MDILDLLTQDHRELQREMIDIGQNIFESNVRQRIRGFIESYERHESVEEELLFPRLRQHLKFLPEDEVASSAPEHSELWSLFDDVMDCLNVHYGQGLQETFFTLTAAAEDHIRHEERQLFPFIRQQLPKKILQALAEQAKQKNLLQAAPNN